jgi:hypothetical protein
MPWSEENAGAISRPRNQGLPGGAPVLANNLLGIAQMLRDGEPARAKKSP